MFRVWQNNHNITGSCGGLMTHFQNKEHLLMWLENNCPRKGIVRALRDGTVEHLGGFSKIPPTPNPGWIVRVRSTHGKLWVIAVIAYPHRYGIRILSEVPWLNWAGTDKNGISRYRIHLHCGDDPDTYVSCRHIAEMTIGEVTE